jgi:hypothetical protein
MTQFHLQLSFDFLNLIVLQEIKKNRNCEGHRYKNEKYIKQMQINLHLLKLPCKAAC